MVGGDRWTGASVGFYTPFVWRRIALTAIYYLIGAACAAGVFALGYCRRGADAIQRNREDRIVSLVLAALFIVRGMYHHYAVEQTVGLTVKSPFGPYGGFSLAVSVLVIWLLSGMMLLLVTYPFFRGKVKYLSSLVRYAGTATYGVALILFWMLARALDGDLATEFSVRTLVFAMELGVGLGISLRTLVLENECPSGKREWVSFALLILGMFAISMPPWAVQALLGHGDSSLVISGFNVYHRLILYGSLAFALPIYFLFRNKDYDTRYYAILFISTATMISFTYQYTFASFLNVMAWPLHLCNTAMYILPLVLMFRSEKVYYFTIFINVLGAFLAMIMPNVESNWLGSYSMEFWLNHYCAMTLPLIVMALNIFPRPKMRQFIYSLVGFGAYYVIILFINAWFTNYDASVDFFFINSDFVASKLGEWAENLRNHTWTFYIKDLKFVLYPLYQTIYFSVYVALSFVMWFMYEQVFEVTDMYAIIRERNRKIEADRLALEVHLAGRSMKEPMNPQNEGKLILRHFSKRYSTSDVYAVYDANLEIEGGQIFGFLGPNGAGKSTIIKSIVGIQTISGGEIEVSGYDVERQAVEAKMQIGFVPDHYALYENLTGREYVNYIADLYRVPKEERDARIAEYVDRFVLGAAFDNPIKTYSHGMKQKITIMSALVHNPKVWILDEPLTGLDPESIFQVKECMKEHAARGNIVFFSSHIIDVVERICDKIAIIRKGQILCTKTVAEIEESGVALEDFYMSMIDGNTQSPVSTDVEMPVCNSLAGVGAV